jgi:YidC/Oxa1 family membrane protein insertase
MFDKKTVIAFILIAIIFIFWQYFWVKTNPEQQQQQQVQETPIDSTRVESVAPTQDTVRQEITPDTTATVLDTVPEMLINVETGHYWITLSNRGGGLIRLQLKDYHYEDNGGVYLLPDNNNTATPSLISKTNEFSDSNVTYSSDANDIDLTGSQDSATITYTGTLPGGSSIEKIFTFYRDRFDFGLTVKVDDLSQSGVLNSYILSWQPGIPPSEKNLKMDYSSYRGGAYISGDMYKYSSFSDDTLSEDVVGNAEWVGSRSKYFTYAIIPQGKLSSGAYFFGLQHKVEAPEGSYEERRISAGIVMPVSGESSVDDRFMIYAGPMDYQILRGYNLNLQDFIDWGWKIIKPFSIAVYWLIYWLHKFIPNYGLVIIIVAILLKIVIYPLTKKQLASVQAMQALQPKLNELKVKYKDNPQKMNQAMMKLYKEEKVNPFGSCLFMLPQMPLLFGLYQVFRSTFELRQAYFLPWWPDLSQPDVFPYPLLILMAVAMFFQQKLSMTDPKHKMMIYLMPIMFFFFFKGFPTGLVLYWTMFSVLSIIETLTVKKPVKNLHPEVK